MKKVTRKVKQALSVLLAAAMVITMVLQTTLDAAAQESVEAVTETETVESAAGEKTGQTEETTTGTEETDVGKTEEEAAGEVDEEETVEEETVEDTEVTDTEATDTEEATGGEAEEIPAEGFNKKLYSVEPMSDSGFAPGLNIITSDLATSYYDDEGFPHVVCEYEDNFNFSAYLDYESELKHGEKYEYSPTNIYQNTDGNWELDFPKPDDLEGSVTLIFTVHTTESSLTFIQDSTKQAVIKDICQTGRGRVEEVTGDFTEGKKIDGFVDTWDVSFKAGVVEGSSGKVSAVKANGGKYQNEVLTPAEDGTYTLRVTADTTISVEVEPGSEPKEPEADGVKVAFVNNTNYMNLNVTAGGDTNVVNKGQGQYILTEGAKNLEFTVTSSNSSYEPVFEVASDAGLTAEDIQEVGKAVDEEKNTTVYSYKVAADKITSDAEITIGEKTAECDIAVAYKPAEVAGVKFLVDGESREAAEPGEPDAKTGLVTVAPAGKIIKGQQVQVTVTAKDGYKITAASDKVGEAEPVANEDIKFARTEYVHAFTAASDIITNITTEAQTEVVVLSGTEVIGRNKNENYDVDYSKTYSAEIRVGGVAIPVKEARVVTADVKSTATAAGTKADITLSAEDAGSTVEVSLKVDVNDEERNYSIKLEVAAAPTEVVITGVENGKLTQNVGTVKEYPVTLKPAGAGKSLAATSDKEAVTAEVVGDNLRVTVTNAATVQTDFATITIYDSNDENQKALTGGTITVTTANLLNKVTPTVALKSATDIDLVLTLGSKVNEAEAAALTDGKLYYMVVVTPADETDTELAAEQTVYVERTGATDVTAPIKVAAAEKNQGEGKAASFKVDVTLVQTKSGVLNSPGEENVQFKTAAKSDTVATKKPYFTTKLGVKKLNGGKAYTGQTVEVAQLVLDKDTTWTNFDLDYDSKYLIGATIVDGKIRVTVPQGFDTGKRTIYVCGTDSGRDLHVATATVQIDIVRGIENLSITAPETLYKKDNRTKASFKADVIYNNGSSNRVPKTKKVEWTVTNTDDTELSAENAKYITVKNGTVTVDKNYVVSVNKAENKFRLNVKAADYEGNTVSAHADFEITSQAAELGDMIIVKDDNYGGWTLVDVENPVNADELEEAYAVVLKKGVAIREHYTEEGLAAVTADAEVTFKSSNKAVSIDSDGYMEVYKTAKKVKITATATDGSKNFSDITIAEVKYTAASDFGLCIQNYDTHETLIDSGSSEKTEASFYGKKDTVFNVVILAKNGGNWENAGLSLTDVSVSVKGAKVLDKDWAGRPEKIAATGTPITITLTSKSLKVNNKNFTKTFTITNSSIPTVKTNAPKLVTKDKLISDYYEVPEEPHTQTVTYTLPKEYAGKFIQITSDSIDAAKNGSRYDAFEDACDEIGSIVRVDNNGQVTLTFKCTYYYGATDIPVGSYKLNYLVGDYDADGNFVAETKPGSVTLKAAAQKAVKAKLNTSYTMSVKEGAKVELALNNKNVKLVVSNLENANIKGEENHFTTYFEHDGNYLKLKDTLSPEQLADITSKAAKNNLTGWVSYMYTDDRGVVQGYADAQIKVSFKDLVQKYSLSKATILSDADNATVEAYAGKEAAPVKYVLVTAGKFTAATDNEGESKIVLNKGAGDLATSNKVTLRIVPQGSCYDNDTFFSEEVLQDETAFADAMNKYGIEVKTTVAVKPAATTTGKIKVDSKAAAKTFTATKYGTDYLVNSETKSGFYVVTIPYTTTVEYAPETVTAAVQTTTKNAVDADLFTAEVNPAKKEITVKLSKAALVQAVADKKVAYSTAKKAVKRAVTLTLSAEGYADETVKLNLTLPQETKTYADVKEDIAEVVAGLTTGEYIADDDTATKTANEELVANAVKAVVPVDSDTDFGVVFIPKSLKTPTKTQAGSIQFVVLLADLTGAELQGEGVATATLSLEQLEPELSDIYLQVVNYTLDINNNNKATNSMTAESLLKGAREAAKIEQYPNFRIALQFDKTEATTSAPGRIYYMFVVKDITTGDQSYITGEFTIAQILTLNTVRYFLPAKWTSHQETGDLRESLVNVQESEKDTKVKQAVIAWAEKYINNDDLSIEVVSVTFTASTSKTAGSLTAEFSCMSASTGNNVGFMLDQPLEIDRRETATYTGTFVKAALDEFEATNATTAEDVLSIAKDAIKNPDITAAWSTVDGEGFTIHEATNTDPGSITGKIILTDAGADNETATVDVELTIAQLP